MQLISNPELLQDVFIREINKHRFISFATAWAGVESKVFEHLVKNESKIKNSVVGIHFYQTHPDFIEQFIGNKEIKYIQQPDGTFHPKTYLFYTDTKNWSLIVGSANFTMSGFERNIESCVFINSSDPGTIKFYAETLEPIKKWFNAASYFDGEKLTNYRNFHRTQQTKLESLSNKYGKTTKASKPIYSTRIVSMDWQTYIKRVMDDKEHGVNDRIKVLDIANDLFSKYNHFHEIPIHERKFIAGVYNDSEIEGSENWGYFGSMVGNGMFKKAINNNDKNLSKALDHIPLKGQITKSNYEGFMDFYSRSFSGNPLATATRLLTMKRPDTFYCLTSLNQRSFCEDFDLTYSHIKCENYWDNVIERIFDSQWWRNPEPKNKTEEKVSLGRAAFLDSIYYVGK